MTMRCDRCQHWTKPDGDEWEPVRAKMGQCKATPFCEDMSKWDENDDLCRRVILPEYAQATAAVVDGSGYSGALLTTAEHFCAMFQEVKP